MRLPPLLIVLILVAVAAVVGAAAYFGGNHQHAPKNAMENVATAYALTYARAIESGNAHIACELAERSAAEQLGCGTAHERARPGCGNGKVTVGAVDAGSANVHVGTCRLTLASTAGGWKVVADERS